MSNFIPLDKPVVVTEQVWPDDTIPVVTVFNWVYNHKDFIRESIESILMQKTIFPIEIIIHDDASNDGTKEIIVEYQEKYPQLFRNILHEENQWSQGKGLMAPLFEKSRGKYFALSHGDDYWTDPLKLQKQVDFLERNLDYGLVYTDVDRYFQNTGKIEKSVFKNILGYKENTFEDFLINGWWLAPCTWMIKRDTLFQLPSYPLDFRVGDYPLLLSLSRFSKVGFISGITAVYRVLQKSLSRENSGFRFEYYFRKDIFDIQLYFCKKVGVSSLVLENIYAKYYSDVINNALLLQDKAVYSKAYKYLEDRKILSIKSRLLLYAAKWPVLLRILVKIFRTG